MARAGCYTGFTPRLTMIKKQNFEDQLQTSAIALAEHIDKHAGDYPLVELNPTVESSLSWEYSRISIKISFSSSEIVLPLPMRLLPQSTYVEVVLPSAHHALRLVHMTEAIRQNRTDPYIILGRMP